MKRLRCFVVFFVLGCGSSHSASVTDASVINDAGTNNEAGFETTDSSEPNTVDSASDGSATGAPRNLTPLSTNATPYQVILFDDAHANFAQRTYTGTLNGTPVAISRVSPTRLGLFIAPSTTPGSYVMTTSADGVTYNPITLTIGAATTPPNPIGYVQSTLASSKTTLQGLQQQWASNAALSADFDALLLNVSSAETQFQQMDTASQTRAATLLAALNAPQTGLLHFDGWWANVKPLWGVVGAQIVVSSALLATANPLAVVALGALALSVGELLHQYGTATTTSLEEDGQPEDAQVVLPLSFVSGQPRSVPVYTRLKNLSKDDFGSPIPLVQQAVEVFTTLTQEWSDLNAEFSTPIPNAPDLTKVDTITQVVPADLTLVAITNVSSSAVTLTTAPAADGTLNVTATNTACPSVPTIWFTFSLAYDDHVFPAVTSTITAAINCDDWTCGTQEDGCGHVLNFGTCLAPQTCGGGGVPNRCGGNSGCVPGGAHPGGCNACPPGMPCVDDGSGSGACTCGIVGTCTPATSCPSGACGLVPSGCGGTIDCGPCPNCLDAGP